MEGSFRGWRPQKPLQPRKRSVSSDGKQIGTPGKGRLWPARAVLSNWRGYPKAPFYQPGGETRWGLMLTA
jgi:hypothetical protein